MDMLLSNEILEQLEQGEAQEEEVHKLSLNAISGDDTTECIRIRALIQN
jgi:hypothetical protein